MNEMFKKAATCPSLSTVDADRYKLSKFMYHKKITELAANGSEEAKIILAFRNLYGHLLDGRSMPENRAGSILEISRGIERII